MVRSESLTLLSVFFSELESRISTILRLGLDTKLKQVSYGLILHLLLAYNLIQTTFAGVTQLVEFLPSKQVVAGSSPVSRSIDSCCGLITTCMSLGNKYGLKLV